MTIKLALHSYITRLFQLALALVPAFTGLFAVMNNLEDAKSTISLVIDPLLSMNNVRPEFIHSWRAIHSPSLLSVAYFGMTSAECMVGILALIGIIKMLWAFSADHQSFSQAVAWVRAACVWGVLVWGLGFYTMGGDFFLAWQNPNLSSLQTDGLNYVLMMAVPYVFFKLHESSDTI